MEECDIIKSIRKKYEINTPKISDKQVVVELKIPKNNSNYGLLGVKYRGDLSVANIIINVNEYEEDIYEKNISIKPDIVHKGIPKDYIDGILKSIEKNKDNLLKCGSYEFNVGAQR